MPTSLPSLFAHITRTKVLLNPFAQSAASTYTAVPRPIPRAPNEVRRIPPIMAPELRRRVSASGAAQGAAGAGEYDGGAAEGARGAGGGSASAGRAGSEVEASEVEASSRPSSGRRIFQSPS